MIDMYSQQNGQAQYALFTNALIMVQTGFIIFMDYGLIVNKDILKIVRKFFSKNIIITTLLRVIFNNTGIHFMEKIGHLFLMNWKNMAHVGMSRWDNKIKCRAI